MLKYSRNEGKNARCKQLLAPEFLQCEGFFAFTAGAVPTCLFACYAPWAQACLCLVTGSYFSPVTKLAWWLATLSSNVADEF